MTSSAPKARRRLTRTARRSEILDTAARLIAHHGFRGVSIQDIAAASGMAKAGVMHHFTTKNDLLIALLEDRDALQAQEVEAALGQSRDRLEARARLVRIVEGNFEQPEVLRLFTVLNAEALEESHPAHEYFQRRLERMRALLTRAFEPWHPDPDTAALEVLAFLDGVQLMWLRDSTVPVHHLWRRFLDQIVVP